MAYQPDSPPYGFQPPVPKRWPLTWAFVFDLVIIIILIIFMSLAVAVFIYARAAQQGLIDIHSAASFSKLSQDKINQLLGPGGVFITLVVQNAIFVGIPIIRIKVLRAEPLSEIGFVSHNTTQLI